MGTTAPREKKEDEKNGQYIEIRGRFAVDVSTRLLSDGVASASAYDLGLGTGLRGFIVCRTVCVCACNGISLFLIMNAKCESPKKFH